MAAALFILACTDALCPSHLCRPVGLIDQPCPCLTLPILLPAWLCVPRAYALQGGKRRTIVPAKVASLEVNPLFQLPEPEPGPQQAQQAQQAQQPPPQGAPPRCTQAEPASPQQLAARRARPLPAEPLSPPLLPAASPAAPAPLGQRAGQPPQPPPQQQAQQQAPQQQQQQVAQEQAQQPGQLLHPQHLNAADMALPMSPPPVAVRLPAPGAALAASLLLRGGGGGGGGGGGDSASSTPTRRITPIRMQQPAEVQPTFLTAAAATSPRSARRDMLAQPEMLQSLSRPGSRLGTPLAGAAAAAFGREGLPLPAATPASVSRLGGGPGGSGSRGSGSGGGSAAPASRSASGRSPLLWPAEEQSSVCQQLSFDSLLSPVKPAAAAGAARAAAGDAAAGSGGKKAAAAVEVSAHAGPCPGAAPLQQSDPGGPEQLVRRLAAGGNAAQGAAGASAGGGPDGIIVAGASSAQSSRQTRALEAAMRRMAPLGGSSCGGFDAPSRHSSSSTTVGDGSISTAEDGSRTSSISNEVGAPSASASATCPSAVGTAAAAPNTAPLPLQLPEPAQQQMQQQLAGEAAPPGAAAAAAAESGGSGGEPRLCGEARRLAELHAALLRRCSSISLAGEPGAC